MVPIFYGNYAVPSISNDILVVLSCNAGFDVYLASLAEVSLVLGIVVVTQRSGGELFCL